MFEELRKPFDFNSGILDTVDTPPHIVVRDEPMLKATAA
jgi:hypothetical protein